MSSGTFFRSRIPQQTFNIPQMIPGGVTVAFQYTLFPPAHTFYAGTFYSCSMDSIVSVFGSIDAIAPPEQLFQASPSFSSTVLATSP